MGDFDPFVPEPAPRPAGRRVWRALVVGITKYDEPTLAEKMQYCSEAAQHLADQLEASGYEVRQLHDEPGADDRPTLAAVRRELVELMERADENDTVLFYFGGHGVIDEHDDRPKLLMADTRLRKERYTGGVLTIADLLTGLRGRPRFTVVLLDACHMGLTLDPELATSTREVASREKAGGFALLSGSTSDDVTQDSTSGPVAAGAFTLAVLAGLKGGATDHDGGVRFSSLARFVQEDIERWKQSAEAKTIDAQQRPVLRLEVADVQVVPPPRGYRDLTPPPVARITCARFSADGRTLVTGGADGAVGLWDAATCTPLHPPFGHDAPIASVDFSTDGSTALVVTKADRTLGDPLTGGPALEWIRVKQRRGEVNAVAWSRDGFSRAVATTQGLYVDSVVDVTDVYIDDMGGVFEMGKPGTCYTAALWANATSSVISGDADGNVCLWGQDAITRRFDGPVRALDRAGELDRYVAVAAAEPLVWDTEKDKVTYLRGHGGTATAIAFSSDGRRVATACTDGLVRLFDARTGKLAKTLRLGPAGRHAHPEACALCFSPTSDWLFAGYSDGRGRRFQL